MGALAIPGGPVHRWFHCNIDSIADVTSTAAKAATCSAGTSSSADSSIARYPVPSGMEGVGVPTATIATDTDAIDGNLSDNWNSGNWNGTFTMTFPTVQSFDAIDVWASAGPQSTETYVIDGLVHGAWTQIGTASPDVAENPGASYVMDVTSGTYSGLQLSISNPASTGSWISINDISLVPSS